METDYDELGRIEKRTVKESGVSNPDPPAYEYEYYEEGPEETLLKKETAPSGHATEYTYDDEQNIESITEIIDGQPYTTGFEYDEFGKPTRKEYPSGFAIRYEYDNKQYLRRIISDDGQLIVWEVTNGNAQGQLTNYTLGNGLAIEMDYGDDFFPKSTTAYYGGNTVFSFEYDFDAVNGNLKSRNLHGTEEHFFYDTDGKELNRLAGTGPNENTISETYAFADNGNITSKAGMGPYEYDNDRKNAVAQVGIQNMGSQVDLQNINYNHFNSASEILNLDDDLELLLEYGPDDQRRKAVYTEDGDEIKTRIYAGAYEKQINADLSEIEVNYISAGGQLVAMYVVENGTGSYYYPHQDHLGSIIHITDANGDVVYTQSFDPWGRTRNPDDLTYDNIPSLPDWLWRGYTGHEHLDEFGLINMNGRLYDPIVGRMLSPDNYVQSPDFTQSYNRYSYVWNNPLKYTDPDGEWVHMVVGAVVGGVTAYISGRRAGLRGGDLLAFTAASAAIGAVTAGVGVAVGSGVGAVTSVGGFAGGFISGAAGGAAGGFVGGFYSTALSNVTFGTNNNVLSGGLKGAAFGAAVGGIVGGVVGGIDAVNGDASFWNGKYNGEIGGFEDQGWSAEFLDEEIPAGTKPTASGEIATTEHNPSYGKYGMTRNGGAKAHRGVDYLGEVGDDVYAMYEGDVTRIWNSNSYGPNAVRISATLNGKYYNVDYGHLSKTVLQVNQSVNAGDLVGYMGRMGNLAGTSFPTHVHIAVWRPLPGNIMGFVQPSWQ